MGFESLKRTALTESGRASWPPQQWASAVKVYLAHSVTDTVHKTI